VSNRHQRHPRKIKMYINMYMSLDDLDLNCCGSEDGIGHSKD